MKKDLGKNLDFLPLGGTGRIGMNFNLYRCGDKWLAVDCGLGFSGPEFPGTDVMVPDISFIAARNKDLKALIITHAHEDHIGAVPWLWSELRCKIYATPFAAAMLREKLQEVNLVGQVPLHVVHSGDMIDLAPFSVQFLGITHSIPEANSLAIRTPAGNILHTGDFKFDPTPLIGEATDETPFRDFGKEGVLAMVVDSTCATVEGHSGSEATVRESLVELIGKMHGRVAVTCFASNVARLETLAVAAKKNKRKLVLVGRSLKRIYKISKECGYLTDFPEFLDEKQLNDLSDNRVLMAVTGSQGEPRSALARIAADTHPRVALGEGDTVIFSSRIIPGNERAVLTVQDQLAERGVRLIRDSDHHVHVSGHPSREDLRYLYQMIKPKFVIPTHGEWRHMDAQADLAEEAGAEPLMIGEGDILRIAPGEPDVVDNAPVGQLALDGTRLIPLHGEELKARRQILLNGMITFSLALDKAGKVKGKPVLSAPGLFTPDSPEQAAFADKIIQAVKALPTEQKRKDDLLTSAIKGVINRLFSRTLQKKPLIQVHIMRID